MPTSPFICDFAGWGFHEGTLFFVASGAMWISTLPLLLLPEGGAALQKEADSPTVVPGVASATTLFFTLFLMGMVFINFGRNSVAIIMAQYLTLPTGICVGSRELGYIFNTQSAAMILLGWTTGWISRRIGDDVSLMSSTLVGIVALLILATFHEKFGLVAKAAQRLAIPGPVFLNPYKKL